MPLYYKTWRRTMKKLLLIALAAALSYVFAGCRSATVTTETQKRTTTVSQEVIVE